MLHTTPTPPPPQTIEYNHNDDVDYTAIAHYYHPDAEIFSLEDMDRLASGMSELMNSMQLYSSFMKDVLMKARDDKKKHAKPNEGHSDGDQGGDGKNPPQEEDVKDEPPKDGEGDSEEHKNKDEGKKEESGDSNGAAENSEGDKDSEKAPPSDEKEKEEEEEPEDVNRGNI